MLAAEHQTLSEHALGDGDDDINVGLDLGEASKEQFSRVSWSA
jgi:hypothetical protein